MSAWPGSPPPIPAWDLYAWDERSGVASFYKLDDRDGRAPPALVAERVQRGAWLTPGQRAELDAWSARLGQGRAPHAPRSDRRRR